MNKFSVFFVVTVALFISLEVAQAQMPVAVSPGSATPDAVVGQTCPAFSWSSVEGASTYSIAVFERQTNQILSYEDMMTFAAPVLSFNIDAPALSWTPSVGSCLKSGSEYVWYVSGTDVEGRSTWSAGKAFQVESLALTVEQKDAVQEAVKEYLAREAAKPPISSGTVTADVASVVSVTKLSDYSGLMGGAGNGSEVRQAQSAGIPGVEIDNTLTIPFASGTTQLVIGDANYSDYTTAPNLSIGSSTSSPFMYIGQSTLYKGYLGWLYNSTPSLAFFAIGTYNGTNPLVLQIGGSNVGIGYTSPSEKLDVNGNVKANAFLYTSAQTRHFSVSGAAFIPYNSSGQTWSRSNQILYSATGVFATPVHIPDGAVVTNMTVYYYDNSANNFTVQLQRAGLTGGTDILTYLTTSNAAYLQTGTGTTVVLGTINNSLYVYDLLVKDMDGTINHELLGVVIDYTVTSPLP